MSKLPNNLSEEELLKILEQAPEKEEYKDNIALFVSTFGLSEGSLKIPLKLLYSLYELWAKRPLSLPSFNHKLSLLMPNKAIFNGNVHFLLNKDTLKINEEVYNLIRDKRNKMAKSSHHQKQFDNFIESCKIEDGKDWILCKSLHKIYLSWTKSKKPLGYIKFTKFCTLYFTTRNKPLEVAINKKTLNEEKENTEESPKEE